MHCLTEDPSLASSRREVWSIVRRTPNSAVSTLCPIRLPCVRGGGISSLREGSIVRCSGKLVKQLCACLHARSLASEKRSARYLDRGTRFGATGNLSAVAWVHVVCCPIFVDGFGILGKFVEWTSWMWVGISMAAADTLPRTTLSCGTHVRRLRCACNGFNV